MSNLEITRNNLIDRILASSNEKLLSAIETIFISSNDKEFVNLSSTQIEMIKMSELDIKNGDVISQEELDKSNFEWLK
jgi:phosphopantetheine adenylyltransferase